MISVKAMSLLKHRATTKVGAGTAGFFGTETISNRGASLSTQV